MSWPRSPSPSNCSNASELDFQPQKTSSQSAEPEEARNGLLQLPEKVRKNRRFPRHHNRSWYIDLGPVGNCFVCSIASIFSVAFLSIFLTVTVMHLMPYSSTSSSYKRWKGVYNGTYQFEAGSGHFSGRSASNSTSSVAFRFASTEGRLRIDKKRDPEDGRPFFEMQASASASADKDYVRRVRFYSGTPIKTVIKAGDWLMTSTVIITVKRDVWIESYFGSPPVTVKREFQGGGLLLVNYEADNVIYRKRFRKKEEERFK